jgi:hypothetical protein
MPFTMSVIHGPHFLQVDAEGTGLLGDLCGLFDFVATAAHKHGHRRALLNLTGVEIDFSFTDHLELGRHAAASLHAIRRAASVVDPKFRVGTSEKAAQKMGLNLRTFTDLREAIEWLAAEPG